MKLSGYLTFGRRTEFITFLIRSEIIAGAVPTLPLSSMGKVLEVFHSQITLCNKNLLYETSNLPNII